MEWEWVVAQGKEMKDVLEEIVEEEVEVARQ